MRVTNCSLHGWSRDGQFPKDVNGPIQYGENLQALVVSLNTVGAVSIARTHEILANVFDVPLSNPDYTWPGKFKELLLDMKKARDRRYEKGDTALSTYYQHKFSRLYDEIIDTAYAETPVPEPNPGSKRGRKKRGKVLALVDRLKEYKASVCLFIKNFAVQFDNKLNEISA